MSKGPHHHHDGHDHDHDHDHAHPSGGDDPALDLAVPESELDPGQLRRGVSSRRPACSAPASPGPRCSPAHRRSPTRRCAAGSVHDAPRRGGYSWLAGDHHIHTQHSNDAQYRVADQVQHASAYGLDWMVITDHGSVAHAKIGVDKVNPDIVAARERVRRRDVGLPGTRVEHPGRRARHGVRPPRTQRGRGAQGVRELLRRRRQRHDGAARRQRGAALKGLDFLAASVTKGRVQDAMFFANHPARKGLDSPHEIRAGATGSPGIALGMEGAPGHQAAGITKPIGAGSGRGFYDNSPTADSFAGYPLESYRTWGGFDWMTSTVGGLWDSLLSEGRPWWITANSDSHTVYLDDSVRPPGQDTADVLRRQRAVRRPGARQQRPRHDQRRLLARLLQPHPRRRRATSPTPR